MRVLLTGFGPFPGVPANPTTLLAEQFRASGFPVPGLELTVEVLPVTWAACAAWADRVFSNDSFDAILHLGVAATSIEFRVEAVARNRCHPGRPDAAGQLWTGDRILPDGPDEIASTWPRLAWLAESLQFDRIPATVSTDAGDYLCNMLYYHTLLRARRRERPVPVLFFHVPQARETRPPGDDGVAYPLDLHHRAVQRVLVGILPREKGSEATRRAGFPGL